jgi:hypothetical protein
MRRSGIAGYVKGQMITQGEATQGMLVQTIPPYTAFAYKGL